MAHGNPVAGIIEKQRRRHQRPPPAREAPEAV
jgi:hypothetical protein